jgi:hypothetical protein
MELAVASVVGADGLGEVVVLGLGLLQFWRLAVLVDDALLVARGVESCCAAFGVCRTFVCATRCPFWRLIECKEQIRSAEQKIGCTWGVWDGLERTSCHIIRGLGFGVLGGKGCLAGAGRVLLCT